MIQMTRMVWDCAQCRYDRRALPQPVAIEAQRVASWEWDTGRELRTVHVGPRTGRVVVGLYSVWQDRRTGKCEGMVYLDITDDPDQMARLYATVPMMSDYLEEVLENANR